MRVIVQVVDYSKVIILDENRSNEIKMGYNLLVGFNKLDNERIVDALVKKIINLRIFCDDNDKMNLSIKDVKGKILSISQFTLYADYRKGNRPGFTNALEPDKANILYEYFNKQLELEGIEVKCGKFGAIMKVEIHNIGPTTIILDSDNVNIK